MTRATRIAATLAVALGAPAVLADTARAQTSVFWTDWTASTLLGGNTGTATGTVNVDGTDVGVAYSGEIDFTQTSGGTNYFQPRSTFLGALLTDGSPITSDMIAISGRDISSTFTFSAPIVDPFISFVSVGRTSVTVTYTFDAPFTIVAGGPSSVFGGVPITQSAPNVMVGNEGNGTIRFSGTFTSLTFTATGNEYWHSFTIGVAGVDDGLPPPNVVPEPSTVSLLALGLAGLGVAARRRRKGA